MPGRVRGRRLGCRGRQTCVLEAPGDETADGLSRTLFHRLSARLRLANWSVFRLDPEGRVSMGHALIAFSIISYHRYIYELRVFDAQPDGSISPKPSFPAIVARSRLATAMLRRTADP